MTKSMIADLKRYANASCNGSLAKACMNKLHLFPKWLVKDFTRCIRVIGGTLGMMLVYFIEELS